MSDTLPSDVEPADDQPPEPERPFDASDPGMVRERAIKGRRADRERLNVVAEMMKVQPVRKWLWGLLVRSHIFESSFHPNATTMAYREGERNIGLMILADIQGASPTGYSKMVEENAS